MKKIEQLQEENAVLMAQVETLRKAYEASKFTEFGDEILEKLFAATPQQHLAEIRAEAGRAGYELGALQWCFNASEMAVDIEKAANQCAARIRQGE